MYFNLFSYSNSILLHLKAMIKLCILKRIQRNRPGERGGGLYSKSPWAWNYHGGLLCEQLGPNAPIYQYSRQGRIKSQVGPGTDLQNRPPLKIKFFIEDFFFFCSSTKFLSPNLCKNLN